MAREQHTDGDLSRSGPDEAGVARELTKWYGPGNGVSTNSYNSYMI